ncbi:rod shape-determining protein MreC [Solirubrobacter sp. CPCC 204708]|uniref:Cell shape-determining protein MreC n=1 Tax=Solirubrobacter deserti TaxID=2282478 RepID=A0ABT4RUX1_9ACTN|nr:rod shape-determining protein MreC [Solirubrobacter deserti]MBE2316237.1 rod shape-determining protein MreC [Solirubrobacter deserti]MDA0142377.1 rod shape-determining protein MreC [Solirubrobacter deserti]
MHDKAVRRRRAVLVVLVAASLILLTAYYGESSDGRLHGVQRTALSVLGPIQDGASRVFKPVRDLFGWFGDTIDAKDQRDKAVEQRDAYRAQLVKAQQDLAEARQRAQLNTADAEGMSKYGPVDARVYVRSPSTWYQQVQINKGLDDGIHRGDPVINGAGLVGKVADATGSHAVVTLITDQSFATSVFAGDQRHAGSITPAIGAPGDLLYEPVDATANVREGDLIYTAGTTDDRLRSRYPPAILVGTVRRVDLGEGDLDKRIHVQPAADFLQLDMVQVLTNPNAA